MKFTLGSFARLVGRPKRRRGASILAMAGLVGASLMSVAVSTVVSTVVATPAANAGTPPAAPSGWTTTFSDNFAGPAGSAPNAANWFYDEGTGFGTGEIETMTNSTANCSVDGNGDLKLTAIGSGTSWTSCRLESTLDNFFAAPVDQMEMEASVEQPNPPSGDGMGYWPAFWSLGSPGRAGGVWPTEGELDMMEDVNSLNEASATLHDSGGGPGHALIACPTVGCQNGFNTYAVLINRVNTSAEYLEFITDGTVEYTITEASVGTTAWQDAIDHGFFILWDLAMGGNYPNGECNCTTPTASTASGYSMLANWVAVYQTSSTAGQNCNGYQGAGCNASPGTPTTTGTITGYAGDCLENVNGNNTEANPIQVGGCNGSAYQSWQVLNNGNLSTQGGCLDITDGGTTSGTTVDWYACNGTPGQVWTSSNGELVNPGSGLCLTVPSDNTGAQLQIQTCTGASDQLWSLPSGGTTTTTTHGEAPYGGTPAAVPGIVYAANYDTGGQGVAYNVAAVNGTGNSYRSDGVDLEATADTVDDTGGGAYDLGWTAAGQWFRYTVNVATAGTYTVSLRLAAPAAVTDGFHIDNTAGTNLSGDINVPATGGYQDWTTVTANVALVAGSQTLVVDQDNAGWNIHWMSFASASSSEAPYGGAAAAVPGIVYAANYDTGGQGVAYNVTAVNGTGNSYRSDGVDLEATADTVDNTGGGAYDLGWTAATQWFRYTVNVATAGTYTVSLRLAAPTAVTDGLHIDNTGGTNLSGNINVPATGGYQDWTTVTANVALPAGTQTLIVDQDNAGWNVHFMSFAGSGGTTTTTTTTTTSSTTTTTAPVSGTNCSASTAGETQLAESGFTASAPTPSTETAAQAPITNVVAGNTAAGRFTSGAPQAVGDDYVVNMGSAQGFNEIEMAVPDYPTDYASGYEVEVSPNGSTWTTVATCSGTGTPETVSFPAQTDQYVEVVLTTAEATYWWSMEYFYVFKSSSTTTTTASTTTTSTSGTIGAGDYEIVNENSGLCEEPAAGGTANGTAVEQEPCASPATAAQEWEFTSVGSGIYEVLNVNGAAGGEAWNVTGGVGATGSGVGIQIWSYGGGATNEQFKATAVTGGYYTFVAQNSGLCVDTPGASVTAGVQLQQYTCNGTGAQEFKLILE